MGLGEVILYLVIIGFIVFLINRFAPISDTFKMIINFIVVLIVVVWLLNIFVPGLMHSRVPTVR